jgi:hypothetical protein
MTDRELKDLLMGSIIAFGYHYTMCEKYKALAKDDDTWKDAVIKSEDKLKSMMRDIKDTIDKDFIAREKTD